MANNRLYLYDPETGAKVLLAKGWDGWQVWDDQAGEPLVDRLAEFLELTDIRAATNANERTTLRLITEADPEYAGGGE